MKTDMKFFRGKTGVKNGPKVKTLDMRLAVTNQDLGAEIRKAFDLAKSSGQELNLSFSHGTC